MASLKLRIIGTCVALSLVSGCAEAGRSTTIGSATGGAIGAGLGAIVGNQVGNPGEGLVVGGLAGAAAGALIGNSIDAQRQVVHSQDEALERQQRLIQAQAAEIEALRGGAADPMGRARAEAFSERSLGSRADGFSGSEAARLEAAYRRAQSRYNLPARKSESVALKIPGRAAVNAGVKSVPSYDDYSAADVALTGASPAMPERVAAERRPEPELYGASTEIIPNTQGSAAAAVAERDLSVTEGYTGEAAIDSYHIEDLGEHESARAVTEVASVNPELGSRSEECIRADKELTLGHGEQEVGEKLLHYRKALRLCPTDPALHVALGEFYLTQRRIEDARDEFNEALKLDPQHVLAKRNLLSLNKY